MLLLTEGELREIVDGDFKRFKVISKELENEKNGRKDFYCKFEDTESKKYYEINYSHHSDGYYTFFNNEQIKIVLNSKIESEIEVKKPKIIKEKTNKELYYEIKKDCVNLIDCYMNKPSYFFNNKVEEIKKVNHIDKLYDLIYEFCYLNKIEAQSFLEYIQNKENFLLKLKLKDEKYPKIIQKNDNYNISLNDNFNIKFIYKVDRFIISEDNNLKELEFFDISKDRVFSNLSEAVNFCYLRIEKKLKSYSNIIKPTFKKYINITSSDLRKKEKEKKINNKDLNLEF